MLPSATRLAAYRPPGTLRPRSRLTARLAAYALMDYGGPGRRLPHP